MKTVYLEELPYSLDSTLLFERIRDLGSPVFLDSSHPASFSGRFDILTADPMHEITFNHINTTSYGDILKYFVDIESTHRNLYGDIQKPSEDIPFCGGAIGYLSYETGKYLENINTSVQSPSPAFGSHMAFYSWSVIQDHLRQRCVFVGLPQLPAEKRRQLLERLRQPAAMTRQPFKLLNNFVSNFDSASYQQAFKKIQHYILEGDCYQVNLAQRFQSRFEGDPWAAYLKLRQLAAAPFSAYLEHQGNAILSFSPERFISLSGRHVETKPIKGTRARSNHRESDQLAARELRNSSKDRAENLMIVDLLRNDLGKTCNPGSIRVDKLFDIESYPAVHHLVSTISGELNSSATAFDLLKSCFPGGSITGAPKHRAMEIIDELEPNQRKLYCGSIAYISADGKMDSNIAIRTLLCENDDIYCWGGGGIVADSNWQLEYQETFDKVGQLIIALEEMNT